MRLHRFSGFTNDLRICSPIDFLHRVHTSAYPFNGLSLVILTSPQIFMLPQGKASLRGGTLQGLLVQSALEDRFDVFVGVSLEDERPATGSLQTFGSIPFL